MASLQRNLPSWAQVRMGIGLGLGGLGIWFGGWIFLWYRRLPRLAVTGVVGLHVLPGLALCAVGGTANLNQQDLELSLVENDAYNVAFQRAKQTHFGESASDWEAGQRLQARYNDLNSQTSIMIDKAEAMQERLSGSMFGLPKTISLWDLEIKKTSARSEVFIQGDTDQRPTLDDPELMIRDLNTCADEMHAGASNFRVDEESGTSKEAGSAVASKKHESGGDIVCAVCEKPFSKRHELNRHARLQHTRPHKCHIPGCLYATEGFGKHNDLTRHMRIVHQSLTPSSIQEVHLCPVGGCKYNTTGFLRKDHLKRHVTQQHKNLVDSSLSIQDLD